MKLIHLILEMSSFSNWVIPSLSKLKQEYKIENDLKGNEFWDSEEEFLNNINQGKIVSISNSMDMDIEYRSGTESYDELLGLIKSYRSYPEFRNEDTLKDIYTGFKENKPMEYPIVIEFSDGRKRIFSGNTRMDIAFQLGITPKVIIVKAE